MSNIDLFNGLKEIVGNHYSILKEAYEEVKLELYEIHKQLNTFNKYLDMVKSIKDVRKKNCMNFYCSNVFPILMDSIEDIIEDIDEEDYEKEASRLEMISNSDDDINDEEILRIINMRVNQLNEKIDSIGNIKIYSEQINRIKKILKSLNSNMFFEDEMSFNNLNEYIEESDFEEETKNTLLNYLNQKRNDYLEKQEHIQKERELRKRILEKQRIKQRILEETKKNEIAQKNNNTYKFNYEDFFSLEDLELIKEVNSLIYKHSEILDNISQEIVDLISESLKYKELGIEISNILPNYKNENYNNIVILFEIKNIILKINKTINFIKNEELGLQECNKFKNEMINYLTKINDLYSEYVYLEDIEIQKKENVSEKHIIYLTNESNEILFKNDIKKDQDSYTYFIKMLEDLKKGIFSKNFTKDAKYSNNNLLIGVCKKKHFQSRLVYYPYKDFYIVFLGFNKKSNNNKYEADLVIDRFSHCKGRIERIISDLEIEEKRNNIIEQNDKLHDEIIEYLKENSRSKKKNIKY